MTRVLSLNGRMSKAIRAVINGPACDRSSGVRGTSRRRTVVRPWNSFGPTRAVYLVDDPSSGQRLLPGAESKVPTAQSALRLSSSRTAQCTDGSRAMS